MTSSNAKTNYKPFIIMTIIIIKTRDIGPTVGSYFPGLWRPTVYIYVYITAITV